MPFIYLMGWLLLIGFVIWASFIALITLGLSIIPSILAYGAFWAAFSAWLDSQLHNQPAISQSLELKIKPDGLSWSVDSLRASDLWPYFPLMAASAVAIAAVVIEMIVLSQNEIPFTRRFGRDAFSFTYFGCVIAIGLSCFAPFVIARKNASSIRQVISSGLESKIAARFQPETALLQNIVAVEQQMIDVYASIGLRPLGTAQEACRDVVLEHALGSGGDAHAQLSKTLSSLKSDAEELQKCVLFYESTRLAFEEAASAVIQHGSTTLLDELDKIKQGLNSELLLGLLESRKWQEGHEVLHLMHSELEMLKKTAEGGKPFARGGSAAADGEMPKNLDEAYRVLNVHAGTSKEVINKLVTALRQTWHPDRATDDNERKFRLAKIQQIHGAWDIVKKLHPLP